MSSQEDHVPVENPVIGLDRSAIDRNGLIQAPHEVLDSKTIKAHCYADDGAASKVNYSQAQHDTIYSIKQKTHHAAVKIRKTLHINKASDYVESEGRTVLADDADEQSGSRLVHQLPEPEENTLKDVVHHPIDTVKSKVSGQGNQQVAAKSWRKKYPMERKSTLSMPTLQSIARRQTKKSSLLMKNCLCYCENDKVLPQDTAVKPTRADFEKKTADQGVLTDWKGFAHQISAILYLVIERRVHGNTLDDLRNNIVHRDNTQKTTLFFTEYIDKKGDEKWVEDLLQGAGPWLMVQLADLANFFESARNFYEWQVPHRTLRTLVILALAVPITTLVPLWLLVKFMTLATGITFFGPFPIATNFPDYRLLVTPSKRLLWNIPTHAEGAIKYIQAEGTSAKTQATTTQDAGKASTVMEQEQDYGSYTTSEHETTGRVVIQISSVRFVSNTGNTVHWALSYDDINSLEKQDRIVSKNVPSKLQSESGKDLRLTTNTGEERVLQNVEKRDEVFSQIIGFSETNWQVVW
ncbi:hypothetical protein N0V90_010182 [Kalmusia sp. IMI 367209]|nr:hypothetical protein N0V90_010182 [Kalmusia sp. IMI 367209]